MGKRLLWMACVAAFLLALPVTGLCRQQFVTANQLKADAEAGWHETYSAHGRAIDVSIGIDFPPVDAVPVIRVRETAPNLTGVSNPDAWTLSGSGFSCEQIAEQPDWSHGWHKASVEKPAGQIDWQTPMTEENEYTPQEAYDILKHPFSEAFPPEIVDSLYPISVWARGHLYEYDRKTGAFGDALDHDSSYEFLCTQQFHGIPILRAGQHGLFSVSKSGEERPPLCRLNALILSEDSFRLDGSLVEEAVVVHDDIPLASIDQVIARYEELIAAGLLREVQALRFGYMLCVDPEEPEMAYAIPVWVLDGVIYDTAAQEAPVMPETEAMKDTRPYRSAIVYAQSGELLDVTRVDPQRRYAPEVLSWQEINP